ncbi:MAG: YigZ family protein [Firmicutes bacterium]|nr:YigZ family protein [Bacillota bacterium]
MLINQYEIIVKKSRFIGLLYDVKDVWQVKVILENVKKDHPKARHMPYAYVIGTTAKKTDDKEPHNTAGIQIYNQLILNKLDHHLLIIIRYYGGTKLGASNLLRTYLACAKGSISK